MQVKQQIFCEEILQKLEWKDYTIWTQTFKIYISL